MDKNGRPGPSEALTDESLKIALPLVAVGAFVLALSFAFCCYLARCKHQRPKISGYKKVVLNRKKENPLQETKNESCPVCLEDFQNKETLAICSCGHVFHKKCLKKWLTLKPTCPMCMAVVMDQFGGGSTRSSRRPMSTSVAGGGGGGGARSASMTSPPSLIQAASGSGGGGPRSVSMPPRLEHDQQRAISVAVVP